MRKPLENVVSRIHVPRPTICLVDTAFAWFLTFHALKFAFIGEFMIDRGSHTLANKICHSLDALRVRSVSQVWGQHDSSWTDDHGLRF